MFLKIQLWSSHVSTFQGVRHPTKPLRDVERVIRCDKAMFLVISSDIYDDEDREDREDRLCMIMPNES
jgi:hypothetical protein